MTIGDRIRKIRDDKNLTQTELGNLVGLTYVQIGRYEKGKSSPSSEVLQKLAKALDTTADFLMSGGTARIAEQLSDKELLRQFQEVEKLEPKDKDLVKTFIDAFITKREIQKLAR